MQKSALLPLVVALGLSLPAYAEELLSLSWDTYPPLSGRVTQDPGGGGAVLVLENDTGSPQTSTFARLEHPGVTAANYALHGTVRYDGIEGMGYLEMWSVFPDDSRYFSRTMAESGPMRKISGTSGWREFAVPFSLMSTPQRPSELVLNVMLQGKGTVFLGPLRLVEYESDQQMIEMLGSSAGGGEVGTPLGWWSPIAGEALMVLGGFALVLASGLTLWLARRGKTRVWGLSFPWFEMAVGALALAGSVPALLSQQPAWVRTPLIVVGLMGVILGLVLRKVVPARYTALELRRMQSQNVA